MVTVSARPDNLAAYRSTLEPVDQGLRTTAGSLLQTLETYCSRSSEFGADHGDLAYALGEHAMAMEELDGWVGRVSEAFRHADRAPGEAGKAPEGVVLTTDDSVKVAEPEFEELEPEGGMDAKAIAGLIADIAGIFDPTPISDGVSAGIDLSDGDLVGAGLSLISFVPYLGDALAKPVKFFRKIIKHFPVLKRLGDGDKILDLLKHLDWKNPARLNRALGILASLQKKTEVAYKNKDWLERAKKLELPTKGPVPFVPPRNWDPKFPKTTMVDGRAGYIDTFGNVWIKRTKHGDWDIQARKGFESLTQDGRSLSVGNDGKLQHAQTPWTLSGDVTSKIPGSWKGQEIDKGPGTQWKDPANPSGNHVRIDRGDPNNSQEYQKVDHVVIFSNGSYVGRDGQLLKGKTLKEVPEAHIPLSEYRKWKSWDKP
ncbi:MAG: polymorphic toxin type 17 domain-containing protein [Pseudonocardiaceae bacterium]